MIKKGNIHGIISFVILELTIVISIYVIAMKSLLFAAIYFIGSILAGGLILFLFCSKCTAKNNCSHVYPGQLAKLFPDNSDKKYKITDYIGTGIAVIFILLVPQIWLWSHKIFFIAFWLLIIIATLQINKFVCGKCKNTNCALCKEN